MIASNAALGLIDPSIAIARQSIYIYSGGDSDTTAPPRGQEAQKAVYESLKTDAGIGGVTDVIASASSPCPTSDSDCCDIVDSDPDCPQAWEYEDQCSCITDSSDPAYVSEDDAGCTPCECFPLNDDGSPKYPRSFVWDYTKTERKLHYNRRATGHRIISGEYIEALKKIWMDIG